MRGRYFDGETARTHEVEIEVSAGHLAFAANGAVSRWTVGGLRSEQTGGIVRLSHDGEPGRLLVSRADWSASGLASSRPALLARGEARLIAGLALFGAAIVAVVFIGVPAASGPLARATPAKLERQMGDNFDAQLSYAFPACMARDTQRVLRDFGDRLEGAPGSQIDIRVRAVEAPFANAFALPGGAVLVTDDLIALAETPDELAAVIAHEAAHVKQRHVMKSVWRSLGVGLILDAFVGGGTGAGQQAVLLAGNFTELSYSRDTEVEADRVGRAMLHARGLSSKGMAPFFERLAAKDESEDSALVKELVSSHPSSLRRASLSRADAKPGAAAFKPEEWRMIKAACESGDGDKGMREWMRRLRLPDEK